MYSSTKVRTSDFLLFQPRGPHPRATTTHDTQTSLAMASEPPPSDLAEVSKVNEDPQDPLADVPPLSTVPTTSAGDHVDALRLIADSIAQQRQTASRSLIFHPLNVSVFLAALAVVAQYIYKGNQGNFVDMMFIGTTWAACVMVGLVTVRKFASEYLPIAEERGTWRWLDGGDDVDGKAKKVGEDVVVVSRFGEEIIGALLLRFVTTEEEEKGGGRKTRGRKGAEKGLIRAWTVKLRYRGKGIGAALLEEAVKICMEKGVEDIAFADDHANSARVLWSIYNGPFDRGDKKARRKLERVKEDMMDGEKVKKGKGKGGA
jgi:ribosomal protein S18 acetylase RimI-like enzyme